MKIQRTFSFVRLELPLSILAAALIMLLASPAARAQTGSVEFVARITPSSGVAEPVRQLPFYLLSRSFAEIRADAEQSEPKHDLDAYVDKLTVSKELKAWMKKNKTAMLSGEEFVNNLTPADIMDVPEFFTAYVDRNTGDQSINFPEPKYKPRDIQKNPERYAKMRQDYLDAIRKFIAANPDSKAGMDLNLDSINPGPAWRSIVGKRDPAVKRHALELAQTHYLVAKAETDLDGRGFMRSIPAGSYWIGTLDIYATVGDSHLQWDAPVRVSPGETSHIELTNSNAAQPQASKP